MIRLTATLLIALALPLRAQEVLVVDEAGGPGTDFATLQAAIDAASEGDLLFLRPGSYTGDLVQKSLVLQGGASAPDVEIDVSGLLPGQFLAVRGCDTVGDLVGNQGAILLEDGDSSDQEPLSVFGGYLTVDSCDALVLGNIRIVERTCTGHLGVSSSSLSAYGSHLEGTDAHEGGHGDPECLTTSALALQDARLFLHGSFVKGGDQGTFYGATECPAPGIVASLSEVEVVGSTVRGGSRSSASSPCPIAPAYQGVVPYLRPGTARSIDTPSPIVAGQVSGVDLHGDPGDVVHLAISGKPGPPRYWPVAGVYHGSLPDTEVLPVGTIPSSGVLSVGFVAPPLAPGQEAQSYYLQGFFRAPGGERQLGAPTQLHVLASIP